MRFPNGLTLKPRTARVGFLKKTIPMTLPEGPSELEEAL